MKLTKNFLLASAISFALLLPITALALSFDDTFAGSIGFTSTDLKQTVLNVISFVLGLLGLIALVMIIFGIFSLVGAGGKEDKAERAKKLIVSALVGLIVIILAWAIVNFVLKSATQVTS
ncbi:hypothetical protein C4546_04680 [Candidatus Parcubacteria bacterium]|jgi:hypothetical protein|nr:MAG: hypothetical protein C4546_04680 [Candidatus Parcubacteria bacterium]